MRWASLVAIVGSALILTSIAPAATPITIAQPVDGSQVTSPTLTISGLASNDPGDATAVRVDIYAGSNTSGSPVQTLNTTRTGASYSVPAAPLANGTYTAQTSQTTATGPGQSTPSTFHVVATYRAQVLADSPDGYWRMNETSGTNATDLAGGNDNAFYEGGYTLNQPGGLGADTDPAVALNGTSGRVRTGSSRRLGSATGVTVEALVNPVNLTPSSQAIARKQGQYLVRLDNAGRLIFRLWKNGAVTELLSPPGVVTAGAWNHVAATYDGATMRVYVNGTERAQRSLNGPVDDPNTRLYMGSSDGYDYLRARLDEVVTYPRAVSAGRIAAHVALLGGDEVPPMVTLPAPAGGSVMDATPNFGGFAGTADTDLSEITVRIYAGSTAAGPPVQTVTGDVRASGVFSILAEPLATGTYTAQASQTDEADNTGVSLAKTFQVNAEADPSLLVAGDIAGCDSAGDTATAALLDGLPGTVVPAGDLAYEDGTVAQFEQCYDPTWGRHKARTKPAIGGHEYRTPGAAGYFGYWDGTAGDPAEGYYSYDLGSWHVVTLNAECDFLVGGCLADSPQIDWLKADLAANPTSCTAVVLHAPLFSSGNVHGPVFDMLPFWQVLYDAGAEFVVSGDDHTYERFAPQTPDGVLDPEHGIQQFVAGTGGRSHYGFNAPMPNSQVRNANTYGILQLQLHSNGYDFNFVPEAGGTFSDSGSGSCHDDPPPAPRVTYPAAGAVLNFATPYLEGTAGVAPGDDSEVTINIYSGTTAAGAPVETSEVTVAADGTWVAESATVLPDGRYTAEVVQTDASGHTGTSPARTYRVDASGPAPTLTTPVSGAITDDRTPALSGVAGTALGDNSIVTVSVYSGSEATGTPLQTMNTGVGAGGEYSTQPSNDLANGTYSAVTTQGDDAGHSGQSAPVTFSVAGATPSYSAQVLADGPDGYWRMNETSGTTATDLAGANDNAFYEGGYTLNQPGGLTADSDPAVALNGTTGRVRTASTIRLGSATGVTVEALVNPVTLTPASQAIARKHGQYLLRLDNAGRVIWRLWKGGAVTELLSPTGVVTAGSWNHIAATYDGTTMRIYVNGTERAQRTLAAPVDAPNSRLYLGSSDGYDYLNGRLDEVATYPFALTAAKVAAHNSAR